MRFLRVLLLASAGFAVFSAGPAGAAEQEHWRVFVADHSAATVRAVDVKTGALLATIATQGSAALVPSKSGRTVFAVQADANRVSAIASGVALDDHGDHGDLKLSPPHLLT